MKGDFVFGLENAGWPVLLLDSSLKIARANPTAVRFFGLPNEPEEPPISSIWSGENGTTPEKFFDQWERAPSPSIKLRLRSKNSDLNPVPVSICALFKGGDKFFVLQVLPENAPAPPVEEKKSNGESLLQKQKLECALQLARTVALDFNNALTTILGHTSLVLSRLEPESPWRKSLVEVEKSATKAAEIANDLGTFSQQEKEIAAQAPGNLNVVLQRTVESFQNLPREVQIQWSVLLERKLFTAKFDEPKLQQAFVKILENAAQAMRGSGRITVQTRNVELAERSQDRNVQLLPGVYVMAEVSDNGDGIEPGVLPRVFEPFFTTKGNPHRGLGLAWVYGIVTNHGGGVAISSQKGVGTSVRLYLPAESRPVRETVTALQDLRGTQTVLIVDDEEPLLIMGQTILSSYGYNVLMANSGQKALEMLSREKNIDLIITDLVMPSMSGRELVEHISKMAPEMPILCTSGYVWQGMHQGDTAYLQKPFTTQELLLKVKQLLGAD